jgi:RNA-directed DNA polymerase
MHRVGKKVSDKHVLKLIGRYLRAGVVASVSRFLEQKLKLKVNQAKSKVASTREITFLGFSCKGTSIAWSDKAFAKFKQRVKELTGRSWGVSLEFRLAKLAEYLRGWMGYFGISEYLPADP